MSGLIFVYDPPRNHERGLSSVVVSHWCTAYCDQCLLLYM